MQRSIVQRIFPFLFIGIAGMSITTLTSCEPDIPIPVHNAVDQQTKDFFYFTTGSWWVYESNDGFFDTVTVVSYWIDTIPFIDDNDNLISTNEYFSFTYYSSYLKTKYTIQRSETTPRKPNIIVFLYSHDGSSWTLLKTPNETGVTYHGSVNYNYFTIAEKRDTVINSVNRKLWSIDYNYWSLYKNLPVKIELVGGVGITKKVTEFENRTWTLIDSYVFL